MTPISPDHAEAANVGTMQDVVPSKGNGQVPLLCLGGSAGAIPALQAFFRAMPVTGDMAFVVVIHLAPEHESSLAELLARCTPMRVRQVTGRVHVERDTVYVIPPGKTIRTTGNHLAVDPLVAEHGRHVAVDLFLRTLAESHGARAATVILSGMDGDGAIGLKRIKERGGLTIAQDPDEAEHGSMPRSAIATGLVDWVLPVAEMPARIRAYFGIEKILRLPAEDGPHPADAQSTQGRDEAALRDVLSFLRTRTGRDFSEYKRATIVRRIGRRMQVNAAEDMSAYLACLRTRPGEAMALLQDLLISVTNFFRDADCFQALEPHLESLFRGKGPGDTVRAWVVACATGEEAYSIAMMLSEKARLLEAPPLIQVFATDLDEDAIRAARDGLYPSAIEADVSAERLRRFFVREHRGYRVRREIREMVLFAQHDILRDSPFSRVDLISCRNLLIYLNRSGQQRVFQTFHFALQPQGLLFLGSSESAEDAGPLFGLLDKKHRIFVQRPVPRMALPVPTGPGSLALALDIPRQILDGPIVAGRAFQQAAAHGRALPKQLEDARTTSWGDLHFKLLEALSPPSVLVDAEHDILHLSAHAGRFLQYSGGEPSKNLLRAVHPSLRIELRAALYQAAQSRAPAEVVASAVELQGVSVQVTLRATPAEDLGAEMFLVTFSAQGVEEAAQEHGKPVERVRDDPVARQLDRELERLKAHLRDTVEQYEASTEELKASNEELQAMNEELRSATEELETSREELQSINEELTTVNHELKNKVDELGHANSDMHNLMDATAIATVFLDRDLRVMRYTPSAVTLFNLIPSDVGRPLGDLATRLDYPQLSDDARAVLDKLAPIEREVGLADGNWFLTRILPYRTLDDRIAGVVLSFINITERKRAEEVRLWLSAVVAQSSDAIVSFSLDRTILSWNKGAENIYGWTADEAIGQTLEALAGESVDEQERIVNSLRRDQPVTHFEATRRRKDGSEVYVQLSISPIKDGDGRVLGGTAISRDITEQRRAAEALRISEERLRLVVENAHDYAIFSLDLDRRITVWNSGAQRLLGYAEAEVLGQSADLIFTPEDRAAGAPEDEVRIARAEGRSSDDRFHQRKDGALFWASGVCMLMRDARGEVVGFAKILRDQTAVRNAQRALEQSQLELVQALSENQKARHELEATDQAKDRFLAMLSHELRNPLASIATASELLSRPETSPERAVKAAKVVRRQSANMKAQLDDLLDISRLRLGHGLMLRRRPVTVAAIVEAALEATQPAVDSARHELVVELPSKDIEVDGDPVRLSQVIANLVANAAKYTPDRGRITVRAEVRDERVVLEVIDNGIGMDPAEIDRMFELFSQAWAPGHAPGGGLGIGLALVRSIVEMHGGTVVARSGGLGQGCQVEVSLPVLRERPAQTARDPSASIDTNANADAKADAGASHDESKAPLVLIADDNEDAAWGLAQLLELQGFSTLTASGGEAAIALAAQRRPDAMLVDVGMPDINGHEVARRIRKQPWGAAIALIAATGWGQESDMRHSREAGFDAHLTKPLDVEGVKRLITELVADKRA
ncbi:MAG TPA: chemotaxis protein CheB [Ramlibacter sp.]|nr:chemotaxis protein CheB [Ramlibacter sp.]